MGRRQLTDDELRARLTAPGLRRELRRVYQRALLRVCLWCGAAPEPERRLCAECRALNRMRVNESRAGNRRTR